MKPWFKLAMFALASVLAQPVLGQGGSAQDMATPMSTEGTADGAALMAAMAKMSTDMARVTLSGDPDHDFAAMMLPHHEGAVAMANYELAHGKDPAMLALARAIVTAQETEIAEMKAWQAAHPPAP